MAVNGSFSSFYRISYSSDIEIRPEAFLTSAHHSFHIHAFILTSQFHTKLHTDTIWFESKGEAKYTLRVTLVLLFCILSEKTEVNIFSAKINFDDQFHSPTRTCGARGGAVGSGTALQAGKVAGSIPDGVIGIFY